MNSTEQFENLATLDDGGSVPNTGILINCWNNRRTALTRYLQGEIIGAVRVVCVKIYRVVCAECATGGR